jgi:hypothetical protein
MLEENLKESIKNKDEARENAVAAMSKDESIGFHKGSINTLMAERHELLKMVSICEQLVNAHAAELAKLGVTLGQVQQDGQAESQQ